MRNDNRRAIRLKFWDSLWKLDWAVSDPDHKKPPSPVLTMAAKSRVGWSVQPSPELGSSGNGPGLDVEVAKLYHSTVGQSAACPKARRVTEGKIISGPLQTLGV
jgi:hypothetical protein